LQNTSFTIDTTLVDSYQWQQNIGGVWTNLSNNAVLAGTQASQLQFTAVPTAFDGAIFRVLLKKQATAAIYIRML
jgi:hypothetical protein